MTTPAQLISAASSQAAAVSTIATHVPSGDYVGWEPATTATVEARRCMDDDPFSYLRHDASLSTLFSSNWSPNPNPDPNELTRNGSTNTNSVKRASSPGLSTTTTLPASGRAPRLRLHTRSYSQDAHNGSDESPAFYSVACGHSPSGTARSMPTPQPSPSRAVAASLEYYAINAATDSRPQRTARRGKRWPCGIAARLCAKLRSIQSAKGSSSSSSTSCPTSPAVPSLHALYKQHLRLGSRHRKAGVPSSSSSSSCLTSPRDVWEAAECDMLLEWSTDSPRTAGCTDSTKSHKGSAAPAPETAAAAGEGDWRSETAYSAGPALSATAGHATWDTASGEAVEKVSCRSSSSNSSRRGSGSGGSSPSASQPLSPVGMASRPIWLANLATRLSATH